MLDVGPPSSQPVDTHQTVDNDGSAKRRLDSFINKVMRNRDSPLIREPPKPAKWGATVAEQAVGGSEPLPSTCFQPRRGADHAANGLHQGSISAIRVVVGGL